MRICPRCGDYYSDSTVAFCLADGTPLMGVAPNTESWNDGARLIQEKENALSKQRRRLKWRRVASVLTMLMLTMIVYGLAARRYVFLEPLAPSPPSPTISPSPSPSLSLATDSSPSPSLSSVLPDSPTPSPVMDFVTPTPPRTPTPTPSPSPAMDFFTPTPPRTPTPTPSPSPSPVRDFFTPTPPRTPTPTRGPKDTTPVLQCSEADKSRHRDTVLKRMRGDWQQRSEDERKKVIAQYSKDQVKAAVELGPVEYDATILDGCLMGTARIKYEWRISVNGRPMAPLRKEKRFTCWNLVGFWNCR